jgi:hypothetical protein
VIIWDANSGNRCNDINGEFLSSSVSETSESSDPTLAMYHLPNAKRGEDGGWPLFKIEEGKGWISRRKRGDTWRQVCWLPVELRADAELAYFGHKVVVGAASGAVTILDFSRVM